MQDKAWSVITAAAAVLIAAVFIAAAVVIAAAGVVATTPRSDDRLESTVGIVAGT